MTDTSNKPISKNTKAKLIDQMMLVASVVHPLSATPQVFKIYATQSAEGVSLLTWMSFMILGLIFLAYGISHGLKPYILAQVLWLIIDFMIVLGILMYS